MTPSFPGEKTEAQGDCDLPKATPNERQTWDQSPSHPTPNTGM